MRKLLLLCLLPLALPAAAQTLDPTFTSPTSLYEPGSVYNFGPPQTDGKRLITGGFTRVNNVATSNLIRLDANGALDQAFTQNVGQVANIRVLKAGLNGQYLLGSQGGTITAGGLTRTEILRLNADGTGDATFNAGTGPDPIPGSTNTVRSSDYAVQPDGKVLIGGPFASYSGTPAAGLIRLNANGSVDTGFSVGTGSTSTSYLAEVQALLVLPNGQVLVGGYFDAFNGQTANGLARLSTNGSVDTTLPAALQSGSTVTSLTLQPDGKILVVGYLNPTGNSYTGFLRLLASGALDTSFNADALTLSSSYTYGQAPLAVQADGKIVVIGTFSGSGTTGVARLNADGSRDTSFNVAALPSNGHLSVVGLQPNGRILVGTYEILNTFNGTRESTLGQYTSTGSLDATYLPTLQAASAVRALVRQNDGSLLAGGSFTEWNGQPVHRLVHLSATGTLDAAFTSQVGTAAGYVTSLVVQPDSRILVGSSTGVRRLAATGTPDASFSGLSNSYVTKLALQPDGKVLVAGDYFLNQSTGTNVALVRLTSAGAIDQSFNLPATSSNLPITGSAQLYLINALLLQADGRVVLSGFYAGSNAFGYYLTRYTSTGAEDASFTTQTLTGGSTYLSSAYALGQQADGKLLVGGNFSQIGGVARPNFARLNTNGTPDTGFVPSSQLTQAVNALVVQPNGRILLGGASLTSTGATLARALATGQPDASFTPITTPNTSVFALLVQPDGAIAVGGSFSQLGSQPAIGLARLTAPNVLAVAAPAATAARFSAWPVPAHEVLHVAPDPGAQPQLAELLDALGRVVQRQPLASSAEFSLPVAALPAGLYLLRLTYATGAVTRQVAVQ